MGEWVGGCGCGRIYQLFWSNGVAAYHYSSRGYSTGVTITTACRAAVITEQARLFGVLFKGFLPKTGIPGHFGAKNRYVIKPSTNHTPGALRLASLTSCLFSA